MADIDRPMNTSNPRFPLMDSLRAIAALSVFTVHLPVVLQHRLEGSQTGLWPYLVRGDAGVAVFFLISGFLLYRPFAQARFDGRRGPSAIPYGERRALRIIPAYWVALVFAVLLLSKAGESPTSTHVFTPHGLLSYFGFLQVYDSNTLPGGISAAWSLCVEVTFYAMLPLWALLMHRFPAESERGFVRSELLGLAGLFMVGLTWTSVAAASTSATPAALFDVSQIKPWLWVLPSYLDHFAVGMALAVLSVAGAGRVTLPRPVRLIDRAPWVAWLIAALALIVIAYSPSLIPHRLGLRYVVNHELQAILALGLLLPAVFGDPNRGFIRKLLANRMLLWVGLVSYGLYLWHMIVDLKLVGWGVRDSLGDVGFTAVALALSLLLAAASFYIVERPALRLSRRLSHRRRSQDADARMRDLDRHELPEPGLP